MRPWRRAAYQRMFTGRGEHYHSFLFFAAASQALFSSSSKPQAAGRQSRPSRQAPRPTILSLGQDAQDRLVENKNGGLGACPQSAAGTRLVGMGAGGFGRT